MFEVEYHMEMFHNELGHKWVGSVCDKHVDSEVIGRGASYNEALDIAYSHLYHLYPYKDLVKVEMRRGELVGFLKNAPVVENHYKIVPSK